MMRVATSTTSRQVSTPLLRSVTVNFNSTCGCAEAKRRKKTKGVSTGMFDALKEDDEVAAVSRSHSGVSSHTGFVWQDDHL